MNNQAIIFSFLNENAYNSWPAYNFGWPSDPVIFYPSWLRMPPAQLLGKKIPKLVTKESVALKNIYPTTVIVWPTWVVYAQ